MKWLTQICVNNMDRACSIEIYFLKTLFLMGIPDFSASGDILEWWNQYKRSYDANYGTGMWSR